MQQLPICPVGEHTLAVWNYPTLVLPLTSTPRRIFKGQFHDGIRRLCIHPSLSLSHLQQLVAHGVYGKKPPLFSDSLRLGEIRSCLVLSLQMVGKLHVVFVVHLPLCVYLGSVCIHLKGGV